MNFRRNLTIVMTQLCGLLLLCSGAWAQQTLIDFDDVPAGTMINTRYAGVTFSSYEWGTNAYVVGDSLIAPSSPNFVQGSWEQAFGYYSGVTATFLTPQSTVSIDVRPVGGSNVGATQPRPCLQAYAGNTLLGWLGQVCYAGPLPTAGVGPMETLTFTSPIANITRVVFYAGCCQRWTVTAFDNLRFSPTGSDEVPGSRLTLSGPAATVHYNSLHLFIRGTDDRIYTNGFNEYVFPFVGWAGWWEIPGNRLTSSGPAATVLGNELRLFIRGKTDDRIYENIWTPGVGWAGWWEVPGNGLTSSGPAATVIGNELRLYIRGTNDRIYENVLTQGVGWGGWWEVPGYDRLTLSGPAATVIGNELRLYIRGTNDRIYENVLTPGVAWGGWWEVPDYGRLTPSGPTATVHDNKLRLFVRGTDDRIYENVLTPGVSWTGWGEVPDSPLTPSEPRATSYGGRIHILLRDTRDRILMRSYF